MNRRWFAVSGATVALVVAWWPTHWPALLAAALAVHIVNCAVHDPAGRNWK